MAEYKVRTDFNALNVAELKKNPQEARISASRYLKTLFLEIASAVEQLVLRVGLYFVKEDATSSGKSIIHEITIPKHLS